MKPISPVVPGWEHEEVKYAEHQDQYLTLPALRLFGDPEGTIITRWRLTWKERLKVLFTGDLWIWLLTFNKPLQPIRPSTEHPGVEASLEKLNK